MTFTSQLRRVMEDEVDVMHFKMSKKIGLVE